MGEPRRRCSSCGESYAEGVMFCPRDGSALSARGLDSGPDPYLGQTLEEAFRVDALIGAGAVGRVYRAHQLGVERNVALKIMHRDLALNEGLRGRFRREARIAGSLSHPNLVSVLSLSEFEHEGLRIPFLALEYLDGLSLRSALSAQGALPVERTLHILLQIADAVGEAHQHGIVHRDLKPENVMLVRRGDDPDFVKVLDFGVAHADADERSPSVATHAGAIFGSARYVAPECAAGGVSTPPSDVYALATLGYECLSGAPPFDGENAISVLLKQQNQTVPPLQERTPGRTIPAPLARLIEGNLSKSPAGRAQDARQFARDLLSAAQESRLDPGLSSRTRRGHAISPVNGTPRNTRQGAPEPKTPGSTRRAVDVPDSLFSPASMGMGTPKLRAPTRSAVIIVLCFILGVGAALGVATKLGAFSASSSTPKGIAP